MPRSRPKLDIAGMMLLAVATTAVVLLGSWGGTEFGGDSWQILGLAALTLVTAAAFVAVEFRVQEPIVPMSLFRELNFNLTTA